MYTILAYMEAQCGGI